MTSIENSGNTAPQQDAADAARQDNIAHPLESPQPLAALVGARFPRYLSNTKAKEQMGQAFLGPEELAKLLGGKGFGDVPPIPAWITEQLLNRKCPIYQDGKLIKETHLLVFVPQSFGGKSFTARTLYDACRKRGLPAFSSKPNTWLSHPLADKPLDESTWALLPRRDPLCSAEHHFRRKSFYEQGRIAALCYRDYRVVKFLELITGITLYAAVAKKRILTDCYLRCEEKAALQSQVNVGFFEKSGMIVSVHDLECSVTMGLGLARRGDDVPAGIKSENASMT